MKFVQLALVSAATLAVAQPHNHAHRHPARHGSPLNARDGTTTTTTAGGPVVTVYELNGDVIDWDEVEKGVKDGKYVLIQDKIEPVSKPSSAAPIKNTPTSPIPTPTPTKTSSTIKAAQFVEIKTKSSSIPTTTSTTTSSTISSSSSSSSTSTTPTSTYVAPTPTTTSTTEAPVPTTSAAAATSTAAATSSSGTASGSSGTASGSSGIDAEFPDGEIYCLNFPSDYGAVAANWLGLGGWTGVQKVPGYSLADSVISYIETAVSGSGCTQNSYCSYACPPGYQKSQWPASQGATGESVGGLYCNSEGKLELSRKAYPQICTKGVGGVSAKNKLSNNVAICRTDYPGTESETVALNVAAGGTAEVTCPDASTYYSWEGSATSAQYYINPSGYSIEKACQWGTAGSNIGNYAPVNMGVGRGAAGGTYISIFQNAPTNTDGVLDFDINITGGVSGSCSYTGGKFYSNGVESSTGCTVAVTGEAVFEFS